MYDRLLFALIVQRDSENTFQVSGTALEVGFIWMSDIHEQFTA